jgi:chaperonin GroEL
MFKKFTEANLRQIATNCGEHADGIVKKVHEEQDAFDESFGYNALTGDVEPLIMAGIIDPFKVTEMAVRNSISVANVLLSSKHIIINKEEEYGKDN